MSPEETIKCLNRLKQLLDDGVLTPEEVEQEKQKILASEASTSPKALDSVHEKGPSTARDGRGLRPDEQATGAKARSQAVLHP